MSATKAPKSIKHRVVGYPFTKASWGPMQQRDCESRSPEYIARLVWEYMTEILTIGIYREGFVSPFFIFVRWFPDSKIKG